MVAVWARVDFKDWKDGRASTCYGIVRDIICRGLFGVLYDISVMSTNYL